MAVKDRVIYDLERCVCKVPDSCTDCSKRREGLVPLECMEELMKDALELLKEQEAVEPILKREGKSKMYNDYVCPVCDNEVVYGQCYCSECGKPFLWEGR